jgi:serine/threonine protein kinase
VSLPDDYSPDPRRVFGHYEVLAPLGRGGMAEVYRALELKGPRRGQVVALKRLHPSLATSPEYVDLFTSEADLARMLDHPNIVKTYEVGQIRDTYYMAMEFVDGRDVGAVLKQCRERKISLPTAFALYFVKMLLEALAYAHTLRSPSGRALGLVHSDVSPSNLFIARYGEVKLGDFGVARAGAGTVVPEAAISGKPHYLPPEAERGELSQAADLWAANVLLYELLTLQRPFDGGSPEQVLKSVRTGSWTPLRKMRPDIPVPVAALVERAFSRDPAARFPTARAFSDALTPQYDDSADTSLAIASLLRGLFGANLGY